MLEPDARRKWCAKWAYSLSLARNLLSQSLLDHRSFLQWTLDTLAASNLAQLAFTIALVEEHTEEYVSSAAFVRSLVQSSVVKLAELDKSPAQDYLTTSKRQLGRLLRNTFDAVPEGFVSPRIWIGYSHFLSMFLLWEKPQATAGPAWIRHQNFAELKRRNEALLLVESDDLCTHSSATMELHDVEVSGSF